MFHVEHFARPRNPQGGCDFCVGNSAAIHPLPDRVCKFGVVYEQNVPRGTFRNKATGEQFPCTEELSVSPSQVRVQRTHPNLGHLARPYLEVGLAREQNVPRGTFSSRHDISQVKERL